MNVYIVSYVPFGSPSHDTQIMKVFDTYELADHYVSAMVNQEEYDSDELVIETFEVSESL
jgi:hypothetical protein